jgi:hypothetical protein
MRTRVPSEVVSFVFHCSDVMFDFWVIDCGYWTWIWAAIRKQDLWTKRRHLLPEVNIPRSYANFLEKLTGLFALFDVASLSRGFSAFRFPCFPNIWVRVSVIDDMAGIDFFAPTFQWSTKLRTLTRLVTLFKHISGKISAVHIRTPDGPLNIYIGYTHSRNLTKLNKCHRILANDKDMLLCEETLQPL